MDRKKLKPTGSSPSAKPGRAAKIQPEVPNKPTPTPPPETRISEVTVAKRKVTYHQDDGHGHRHPRKSVYDPRQRVFSMRARQQTEYDFNYTNWSHVVEDAEVGIAEEEDVVELMHKSERILRIFLQVVGRYPLRRLPPTPSDDSEPAQIEFEFAWKSIQGIYFVITAFIVLFMCILGFFNLFFVGYGYGEIELETSNLTLVTPEFMAKFLRSKLIQGREKGAWKRGYLLFMVTATNVVSTVICTGMIIKRRMEFAHYFGLWASALQTSQLDVSPRTWTQSIKAVGVTVLLVGFVIVGGLVKLATMVHGSLVTSVMTFRLISPSMLIPDSENRFSSLFYFYQTIGVILTVYLILWARSLIVLYYVKIRELINGIGMWNGRVYSAVLQKEHPQTEEGRTTYALLFKDHCIMLDLLDATNGLFEWILESYFAAHATVFIFEVVFFFVVLRSGHRLDRASQEHTNDAGEFVEHGEFFMRPYDLISVLVLFFLDQVFYFMVVISSGDVTEEVTGGLEIARRSSMIGRKTDEELFFLLSLFNSFNRLRPAQMEGGGFFTINKEIFVSLMVVVVLAVVIGLMFRPIFDWPHDRHIVGPFITALEGLPDCHWRVNSENWTTCVI